MTARQIIEFFGMKELPQEGGFYVETYRAKEKIAQAGLPARYAGWRNFSTAILYLLTSDTFSALHRLKSDEVFHFYLGDAVTMLQLRPDGGSEVVILGHDILKGEKVQILVPRDTWQGAFVKESGKFALLGCTVSPGFDKADYEQGDRNELLTRYPDRRDLILRLTR
jgi:predicted cupin superfamily sugar epimerase